MDQYIQDINIMIDNHFDLYFKTETHMKEVCKYIMQGGKRIRPSIIIDIINTLGGSPIGIGILSIEYIHTASLVVDDLPCMDNATHRRNQVCPHLKYGEAIAQVSSVVLLAMGMDSMIRVKENLLEYTSDMLGIHGAAGGQILDLTGQGKPTEIIYKKTGKFFEFCFIAGWICGGGDKDKLSEIKDVAYNFSMIFQIIDDFEDVKEDKPHNNYVLFYGKEKATRDVNEYLTILKLKLNNVNLSSPFFYSILNYFDKKILQYTNGV